MSGFPPASEGADSVQALLTETGTGGSALYLVILCVIGLSLMALPLVRVEVTARSPGVLRPVIEKHEIRAGAAGTVDSIWVGPNERVGKGQPLLMIRIGGLEERARRAAAEKEELELLVADLEILSGRVLDSGRAPAAERLRTRRYRRALEEHGRAVEAHRRRVSRLEREVGRAIALTEASVLPRAQLEEREYELEQELLSRRMLDGRAAEKWERELHSYRERLEQIRSEQELLRSESSLARIIAPIHGTVEQLAPLSEGSLVAAGERIGFISPDTVLVAEIHVDGRQVAGLQEDTPVRLEFEGFRPSDWGYVAGRVSELPGDAVMVNGRPIFPVRVTLDHELVQLRTGARARLRKGMSLQARFILGRRTLWQLLRDDVRDRVDPSGGGLPTAES